MYVKKVALGCKMFETQLFSGLFFLLCIAALISQHCVESDHQLGQQGKYTVCTPFWLRHLPFYPFTRIFMYA